jgi:membrane associated rhomboid family serine protease
MLIFPYSTALTLSRPPYVSYAAAAICVLVYTLQMSNPITANMAYHPDSWNPIRMLSATFAHLGFWHLFGNLVIFMAFAPALEILIGSALRYIAIMLVIALAANIGYSLWTIITAAEPIPTLGFSGVVMGMIGLSAYLMPRARIRVFCWLLVWKTFFVPAWILAAIYIGFDAWSMFNDSDFGGVNLVAHVAGGLTGYACGLLWLKDRKQEVSDELNEEIEAMKIEQRYGKTRAEAHRYQKATAPLIAERERSRDYDRFMGQVYQMVKTHRDSEATLELLSRYDQQTLFTELEPIFERVYEWGPSRTLACVGRLLIQILDREQRHGRVLFYVERCQALSPKFALPDLSRVLFYAQMALDTGKPVIARNLVINAAERYGSEVNAEQCHHLLQQASRK